MSRAGARRLNSTGHGSGFRRRRERSYPSRSA
jgi:hypothetical protein